MNLRPICIGSVILRFVAGLALRLSRREVDDFFLHNAKAKQFGVGVPSGCNLQALAVEEHLRRHPGAIAIQLDLRNAFNRPAVLSEDPIGWQSRRIVVHRPAVLSEARSAHPTYVSVRG